MRRLAVSFAAATTMTILAILALLGIRVVDWIIGGNWLILALAFALSLLTVYLVDIATDGRVTGETGE